MVLLIILTWLLGCLVAWWVPVIIDSRYEIEWICGRLMGFLIIHSWLLDGLLNHVANASYSTGMWVWPPMNNESEKNWEEAPKTQRRGFAIWRPYLLVDYRGSHLLALPFLGLGKCRASARAPWPETRKSGRATGEMPARRLQVEGPNWFAGHGKFATPFLRNQLHCLHLCQASMGGQSLPSRS